MKFTANKTRSIASFDINLTEIIAPFYYLIINVIDKRQGESTFCQLERIFDTNEVDLPSEESDQIQETFLLIIANYLSELLFETVDNLEKTDILFIHLNKHLIIYRGENYKTLQNIMRSWISEFDPVEKMFVRLIKDEKIKSYWSTISNFVNQQVYYKAVGVYDVRPYEFVIAEKSLLTMDNVDRTIIDNNAVWINKKWNELEDKEFKEDNNIVYELSINEKFIGVEMGAHIIPFDPIDNILQLDYKMRYFWDLLKYIFTTRAKGEIHNPNAKSFRTAYLDEEFCKILSHLKYNLYIEKNGSSLPERFLEYFDEVYSLTNLSNIPDFNIFTGVGNNCNEKSILGVYSKTKIGSQYNLLHWIVGKEENKAHVFSGNCNKGKTEQINLVKAYALKPQYSYYYISKFFENVFTDILRELSVEFINNIELRYDGSSSPSIEIDALILKKNGSLVVIENKTNLSKENIESTLRKFETFHSVITNVFPNVDIAYVIVAPYSNASVEEGFHYFIKEAENGEECRNGYYCKLYDFTIPFARFDDLKLRCIVEPEYTKLKGKIQTILE